jgi:hypothetical protein
MVEAPDSIERALRHASPVDDRVEFQRRSPLPKVCGSAPKRQRLTGSSRR